MRFGKLSDEELQNYVLQNLKRNRSEVLLSATQGEDCAALKIEDIILISSDPITAKMSLKALGEIAVDVACNDIVANGGEAVALMVTLIMPNDAAVGDIGVIMTACSEKANKINVDIIGGHTEFSDCVIRPVISMTAIGKTTRLLKKSDLQVGDKIYVTKYLGIEGTVIISEDVLNTLSITEKEVISKFKNEINILKEGKILNKYANISTMHDITEGGVLGSVAEICYSTKKGAKLYEEKMPVHSLTKKLCDMRKIDPLRFISSGSLMFTGKNLQDVVLELNKNGIVSTEIGEITNDDKVVLFHIDGTKKIIKTEADQLFNIAKDNLTGGK